MTLPWRAGAGSFGLSLAVVAEGASDADPEGEAPEEGLRHELQPEANAAPKSAVTRSSEDRLIRARLRIGG
jgi:hypothetical protein